MFYPYSRYVGPKGSGTATLFALIVILMVPTRAPAMELKIVGNQLFLSGPVVSDEPGKVREALASSPGIETVQRPRPTRHPREENARVRVGLTTILIVGKSAAPTTGNPHYRGPQPRHPI